MASQTSILPLFTGQSENLVPVGRVAIYLFEISVNYPHPTGLLPSALALLDIWCPVQDSVVGKGRQMAQESCLLLSLGLHLTHGSEQIFVPFSLKYGDQFDREAWLTSPPPNLLQHL